MSRPIRVRNARGELVDAASVSASDAKNRFGRILDRVATDGGVAITRRRQPIAVVIPVDAYVRLAGAEDGALNSLASEFDRVLERMQLPDAAAAMQRAFESTPAQLGRAAVRAQAGNESSAPAAAAGSGPRRAKSRL